MEKYRNKRAVYRRGGKFTSPPSLEKMGFEVNTGKRQCNHCGTIWLPILVTGICPQCEKQDSTLVQ